MSSATIQGQTASTPTPLADRILGAFHGEPRGEPPPCECCGSEEAKLVASKRGCVLRQCGGCGLVFVWPQPSAEKLASLYRKEAGYFATMTTDLSAASAVDDASWLHAAITSCGVKKGKFLDIGCANGALMFSMRRQGWDVYGVDVNADAVAVAQKNGLDATAKTLEDAAFEADSFDVVYLGDVIEHIPSPRKICAEIHRILRPGGIVMIRTPDATCGFASWTLKAVRLFRHSWPHSEAPYHLFEFTPRSLDRMLAAIGFEPVWNRSEGRRRFLYRLGATGWFDELKVQMKVDGKYEFKKPFYHALPKLIGCASLLAPFHVMGRLYDHVTAGGASIFLAARKAQGEATT